MDTKIYDIIVRELDAGTLAKVVFSGGRGECKRAVVSCVKIKGQVMWQVEKFVAQQVFHSNYNAETLLSLFSGEEFSSFKQINIFTASECVTALVSKKGKVSVSTDKKAGKKVEPKSHNREKNYLFSEGMDVEPLRDMGIFTADNKVVKSKFDKFKQINRFIEIIDDEFKTSTKTAITILDFGCGKSYLTFLVYYYFSVIKKINVNVIGYDLKADVVEHCNVVAKKYGYNNLEFIVADVKNSKLVDTKVDAIITLHACDTATDYALFGAINNDVKHIFSVPCCQHEINAQIKNDTEMGIILNDGLIKERFSALLTDSVRAEILRQCGYSVEILEFVDFAHSPKNLMIRACKDKQAKKDFSGVENLLQSFSSKQTLYELIKNNR